VAGGIRRGGEKGRSAGTRERIVLIRQRYRKLKFNSRVASGVTHRVGAAYRLSRGTRIHRTSYPEYVIRARKRRLPARILGRVILSILA
jgi:hypothetical protein